MYQILVSIVLIVFIAFSFITLQYWLHDEQVYERVGHAISLSVKVLPCCISAEKENHETLAAGFIRDINNPVEIDRCKLLLEFHNVLEKNLSLYKNFSEIRENILAKVLVYYDRFFIADRFDRWSPPYFFSTVYGDKLYYLNIKDDSIWYYENNQKFYTSLNAIGMSHDQKNNIVIDKLNSFISGYTYDPINKSSINIKIFNPESSDPVYRLSSSSFNVLDGITFFVIYRNFKRPEMGNFFINLDKAIVCGYTLK